MSQKNLTTLTNFPVAFSGGVSPRDYTTRSNRNPFDEEHLGLAWQHQSSDGLMQLQINIIPFSTGKGYENTECLRKRALCHLLLDYLPEEALDEIKDSIIEAINFYSEQQQISLPPYQLNESYEVAIGEGYERPVFEITED